MVKQKLYKCEVCGAVYADDEDCMACEANHTKLLSVLPEDQRFNPGQKYPRYINAIMENGKKIVYEMRMDRGAGKMFES